MEVLPASFRQHYLPAALQYSGQLCGRKIYQRKRTGRCGKQLRDHPDLYRLCLRLQYGMFHCGITVVWGKRVQQTPDRRIHRLYFQRRCLCRSDADGHGRLQSAA